MRWSIDRCESRIAEDSIQVGTAEVLTLFQQSIAARQSLSKLDTLSQNLFTRLSLGFDLTRGVETKRIGYFPVSNVGTKIKPGTERRTVTNIFKCLELDLAI
jgi:hypothetical protein